MTRLVVLLTFLAIPLTGLAELDFDQLDKSVVRVITVKAGDTFGSGTGFVINNGPNVVTNYHVIEGGQRVLVADGSTNEEDLKEAIIKWSSEERDLAVLQVPGLLPRPALSLSSAEPNKGSQVYAIGFPGAADLLTDEVSTESSVTTGSISRLIDAAWEQNSPLFRVVQHSSEINSGNSGGPLVNACGQVVGINTIKTSLAASIRSGEIISGVFFASHASSLIEALTAQNIPFQNVNQRCTASDSAMVAYLGIALIVVGIAMLVVVFSLTRPRQFIQAIETYSRRLRNSVKVTPSQKTKPSTSSQETGGQWLLSGTDQAGNNIRLTVTEAELQNVSLGLTIGRSAKLSELVIKDDSISRRHARLNYTDNHLSIEDLDSLNATKVDGVALTPFIPKRLTSGTTLSLGQLNLSLTRT